MGQLWMKIHYKQTHIHTEVENMTTSVKYSASQVEVLSADVSEPDTVNTKQNKNTIADKQKQHQINNK